MNKSNNKGFTLIELLVTMAILGIVTSIALPLIRNVQEAQENKKYSTFKDSMIYSAKLYVDSYAEDLFGHNDAGCAYIDFEQMLEKNIAKDIQIDKSTCVSSKSYVKVVKLNNQYTYVPYVTCGTPDASGNFSSTTYSYPEGNHEKDETCSIDSIVNMSIVPSVEHTEVNVKRTAVQISISSYTGFNNNVNIYYGFSETENSANIFTEWQKLTFKVPSQSSQKDKILNSESTNSEITITSSDIYTPEGYNGNVYLVLRIDNLMDVTGRNWNNDGAKYKYYGPYRLDNTAPVIAPFSLKKQDGKWYLLGSIMEENPNKEKMFVCTSYNENTCPDYLSNKSKYKQLSSQQDFEQQISLSPGTELNPIVYVKVSDTAGNTTQAVSTSQTDYYVKFNYNGGTIATSTEGYDYRIFRVNSITPYMSWGTRLNPAPVKANYDFLGWANKKTSDSYLIAENAFSPSVSEVFAIWAPTSYSITYNLNKGTVSTANPTTYTVESAAFTLKNPTRSGYTFTGWTGTGLSSANKTVTVPKGSAGARTYTATWTPASYNITYNLDGGAISGGTNPSTYTIETAAFTLKNPTKSGYTFAGWTGTGISGKSTSVTVPKGSTGARSYTATWTLASYNITYNLDGGTISGGTNPSTYTIETAAFTLKNPTKSGYTFAGWTGTGLSSANKTVTVSKGSTGARTYTATWTKN